MAVPRFAAILKESNKECWSGASVCLLNPDENSRVRSLLPAAQQADSAAYILAVSACASLSLHRLIYNLGKVS